jgi:hypothetical protein
VIALAGLSLGSSVSAWAHHSFAQFDHHKIVTLHGVIEKIIWANPHVYLFVVVRGEGGEAETYTVECASVVELTAAGWTRRTLKVGDSAAIRMYPLRNGKPGGLFDSAVLANGKKVNGNV